MRYRKILTISSVVSLVCFVIAFMFLKINSSQAQGTSDIKNAQLLKEYFLPVQALAPIEDEQIVIDPIECVNVSSLDKTNGQIQIASTGTSCAGLDIDPELGYSSIINSDVRAVKTTEGLQLENNGAVRYDLAISESGVYQLKLTAREFKDPFANLTRNQYDYLKDRGDFDTYNNAYAYGGSNGDTEKELAVRSLLFDVFLVDDSGTRELGTISIDDLEQEDSGAIDLGLLRPGNYSLYLAYANDLTITYPNDGTLPSYLNDFANADFYPKKEDEQGFLVPDPDGILEKQPLLTKITLSKTRRTNDVIGLRIYSNLGNLSAQDWYFQNLVRPKNPVPVTIDGYNGVLDGRTAYINAANVNNGVFYTNIYVLAYNENASPQTIEIFNKLIENWSFNQNLIANQTDVEAERIKNRLRRDTKRLEDLNFIRQALERYKSANGHYPDLRAGTFDPGHVISTWPSWQSVFGQELGVQLPLDPINKLATEFYPAGSPNFIEPRQYDCQDEYEGAFCQNICTRNEDDTAKTGCPANQQCVADEYCSLVPPGWDAQTGWNVENQELYFTSPQGPGYYLESIDDPQDPNVKITVTGGYNTVKANGEAPDGGVEKYKNDAFVYQYTAVNDGQSYFLNYRLEFNGVCSETYADGTCKPGAFTTNKCGPGQCYFAGTDVCLEPGQGLYALLDPATFPQAEDFRNLYCFAGSLVNSCGNGILQRDAGETCEFAGVDPDEAIFCDQNYGQQNWYNEANVSDKCTTSCRLATEVATGELPLPYNPQKPGLSCGGYCGDGITQFEFNEQCDEGGVTGPVDPPALGGSGGVSADSQYQCAGIGGVDVDGDGNVDVKECKSFGGFCGDGLVQGQFGEECDIESYRSPTPAQSVNQILNNGFENEFSNWDIVKTANLATDESIVVSLPGISSNEISAVAEILIESDDFGDIQSGKKSLIIVPKVPGSGIGQRVFYQAQESPDLTTINAQISVKSKLSTSVQVKARFYQYDFVNNINLGFTNVDSAYQCQASGAQPNDCLEVVLTNTDNNNPTLLTDYRFFNGQVVLPEPTSVNLNNVTLATFVFEGQVNGSESFLLDNIELSSNYQLQYSCGTSSNSSCQLIGGYCGDGIVQDDFGEKCDLGDKNGTGELVDGIVCSKSCTFPFCGDGQLGKMIKQGSLVEELCDYSDPNDPQAQFCNFDCRTKKLGGSCQENNDCGFGTICTEVSLGSTEKKCTLLPGQKGCTKDSECGAEGWVCDLGSSECVPRTDVYLKYNSDEEGIPFADQAFACPSLTPIQTFSGDNLIKDLCTGLEFEALDAVSVLRSHQEALGACDAGFVLPTAKELLTLVSKESYSDGQGRVFTPNNLLKLCSLNGVVDQAQGGADWCLEGASPDPFLYWTSTKYEGQGNKICNNTGPNSGVNGSDWPPKVCVKDDDCQIDKNYDGDIQDQGETGSCNVEMYYAVNFSTGSLEVLPATAELRTRCLSFTECGNGKVERDEECDFNPDGTEAFINASCTDKGFDAGQVHCDPLTCKLRFDNCVVLASPDESCVDACLDAGYSQVKSYGTNLTEVFPDKNTDLSAPTACQGNQAYCVADNGEITTIENNNCGSLVLDPPNDGYVLEEEGGNVFCPLGLQSDGSFRYNSFTPQRTLCNCDVNSLTSQ